VGSGLWMEGDRAWVVGLADMMQRVGSRAVPQGQC